MDPVLRIPQVYGRGDPGQTTRQHSLALEGTDRGKEKEWDAVITGQRPDELIAWESTEGASNAGIVTFHRLSDQGSKIRLEMDMNRKGSSKTSESDRSRIAVEGDLERF